MFPSTCLPHATFCFFSWGFREHSVNCAIQSGLDTSPVLHDFHLAAHLFPHPKNVRELTARHRTPVVLPRRAAPDDAPAAPPIRDLRAVDAGARAARRPRLLALLDRRRAALRPRARAARRLRRRRPPLALGRRLLPRRSLGLPLRPVRRRRRRARRLWIRTRPRLARCSVQTGRGDGSARVEWRGGRRCRWL